ncbi:MULTISPECIES: hypothetical protein [Legionella]|uniref:Uncharacterized protein n=1 Tax=Legionella resiliens TaxID=2905958 RepID=A0ABS8X387_9GAMM|nr:MULTISPECIES: hypothetical protein [unclassified Legionella]MCE0722572.1 hypothetical protein [Legionella sp. 9fVS26]MCE3531725.1 hypothetical protein [Legionella sp. 8cVS16]QLZ67751.1 hypothetical protein FOLKNPGA_00524 [Legionella sp. PC1000]
MIRIKLVGNNVQFISSDSRDNPKEKKFEGNYLEKAFIQKKWLSEIDYSVRRSFVDTYSVPASMFDSVADITKIFKEHDIDTTTNRKEIPFFKGPEVSYELTLTTAEEINNKISELRNNDKLNRIG